MLGKMLYIVDYLILSDILNQTRREMRHTTAEIPWVEPPFLLQRGAMPHNVIT